jgi:biotin operon repressor
LLAVGFFLKIPLAVPEGIMPVYITLLGAYAADKEIRRWLSKPEPPRKGSLFVYLWLLFSLAVYLIHSFRPAYLVPDNLGLVCIQVLGIFFGSKASKIICENIRKGGGTADADRKALILSMLAAKGQVTRQVVAAELQVSRATAGRLLAELEEQGALVRKGEGKGTYYVAAEKP